MHTIGVGVHGQIPSKLLAQGLVRERGKRKKYGVLGWEEIIVGTRGIIADKQTDCKHKANKQIASKMPAMLLRM